MAAALVGMVMLGEREERPLGGLGMLFGGLTAEPLEGVTGQAGKR